MAEFEQRHRQAVQEFIDSVQKALSKDDHLNVETLNEEILSIRQELLVPEENFSLDWLITCLYRFIAHLPDDLINLIDPEDAIEIEEKQKIIDELAMINREQAVKRALREKYEKMDTKQLMVEFNDEVEGLKSQLQKWISDKVLNSLTLIREAVLLTNKEWEVKLIELIEIKLTEFLMKIRLFSAEQNIVEVFQSFQKDLENIIPIHKENRRLVRVLREILVGNEVIKSIRTVKIQIISDIVNKRVNKN